MSLGDTVDRAQFGNQDPDVYFYGDTIEKLNPAIVPADAGRLHHLRQPTPRWEVTSDSVVINLNDYAIARNMLLRVKGVPLMYLPMIYYPIKDDDRATGFLLPTYGSSTLRGQASATRFFWAIGRSQDATFFHDWFTKTGQGAGAEYRYVGQPGLVREFPRSTGSISTRRNSGRRTGDASAGAISSYQFTGTGNQVLGTAVRGSSASTTHQPRHATALSAEPLSGIQRDAHDRSRHLGSWGALKAGAFFPAHRDVHRRRLVTAVRQHSAADRLDCADQRLFGLPVYGSMNNEFATCRSAKSTTGRSRTTGAWRGSTSCRRCGPHSRA